MADCIFCRIVAGELPSHRIAETARFFAFLDIAPASEGHVLIVPKDHSSDLLHFPEQDSPELISLAKRIGRAAMQATGAEGFTMVTNNGAAAGQTAFHTHFHIIPRRSGDGAVSYAQAAASDLPGLSEKISSLLGDSREVR